MPPSSTNLTKSESGLDSAIIISVAVFGALLTLALLVYVWNFHCNKKIDDSSRQETSTSQIDVISDEAENMEIAVDGSQSKIASTHEYAADPL